MEQNETIRGHIRLGFNMAIEGALRRIEGGMNNVDAAEEITSAIVDELSDYEFLAELRQALAKTHALAA